MSLHISYELRVPTALTLFDVQRFVGDMHEEACRLPFHTVSLIFHATAEQCGYANWRSLPDELQWMVVQNAKLAAEPFCPAELVGFITLPADGAEWAAFGFCRFERGDRGQNLAPICEQVLDHGWHWSAWCSTRHAANVKYGGAENFLRGHRAVIQMLEFCRKCGWLIEVRDQYGYWKHRDEQKLLEKVQGSLAELAAFAGALKDALAGSHEVSSPILEHPDFEHLEAKGQRPQ